MNRLRIAAAAALATLAIAAPAAESLAKPAMPTVTIALGSHYYRPNPLYLAGGVPTRLVFVNESGKTHDFKAPDFFRAAQIRSGAAPGGTVTLAAHRSATVDLIPARGRYRMHCKQPFHAMMGMTGTIVVN